MKTLGLLIFFICNFIQTGAVHAAMVDGHLRLAEKIDAAKRDLSEIDEKQRKMMSAIFELNQKMKKIESERNQVADEKVMVEASTSNLASKVLSLTDKKEFQKNHLRERLLVLYKMGGQGMARLILSSSNPAELDRNLKLLGIVAKHDAMLIRNYSNDFHELENKRQHFVGRLAHLKKLEKRLDEKEKDIFTENSKKSKLLEITKETKLFSLDQLKNFREQAIATADENLEIIELLTRPAFFEKKGQLPIPIVGEIAQKYGISKDANTGVRWANKGLIFAAPTGTAVKSVASGRVSFVGSIDGFGSTVILDHGDHYYSVYSYNAEVAVNTNEEVSSGQLLSRSGTSPDHRYSGLYFEIRHFSEPNDPLIWLKGAIL